METEQVFKDLDAGAPLGVVRSLLQKYISKAKTKNYTQETAGKLRFALKEEVSRIIESSCASKQYFSSRSIEEIEECTEQASLYETAKNKLLNRSRKWELTRSRWLKASSKPTVSKQFCSSSDSKLTKSGKFLQNQCYGFSEFGRSNKGFGFGVSTRIRRNPETLPSPSTYSPRYSTIVDKQPITVFKGHKKSPPPKLSDTPGPAHYSPSHGFTSN